MKASRRRSVSLPVLLRGSLAVEIDDLNAAIDRRCRRARVFQPGLAVTDGEKFAAGDAVFLAQISLDGVGAPLGEILVEGIAANRVGVAGNHKGRAFQRRIRQRLAEFLYGPQRR